MLPSFRPLARRFMVNMIPGKSFIQSFSSQTKPPPIMSKIVWMDLEMTGLDEKTNTIMEICCLITNNDLEVVAEAPLMVIKHAQSDLDAMDEWCTRTHTESGLVEAVLKSTTTIEQAQDQLLQFLQAHVKPKESPLAGNTIYMDRRFIEKYMPKVDAHLHYRLIDVSTCKELCKRWDTKVFRAAPAKRLLHRGYEDIIDSIEELKYYRQFMFNTSSIQSG